MKLQFKYSHTKIVTDRTRGITYGQKIYDFKFKKSLIERVHDFVFGTNRKV